MNCPKSGGFLKISRFFAKIYIQFWLRMSLNCEFCSSRGKLPATSKLKKAKEPSNETKFVRKWRRRLLCLLLLCLIIFFGSTWFTICFKNGASFVKMKAFALCEDKTRILLEHSNVSKNQLHALASFFSESDQIGTIECMKGMGSDASASHGITCALTVSCSDKQEFQQRYEKVVRNVDQCPVQDRSILEKLDLSSQNERYSSFQQSAELSVNKTDHEKIWQKALQSQSEESCESSSLFLSLKVCCWTLLGMVISCNMSLLFLKFWRHQKQMEFWHPPPAAQPKQQPSNEQLLQHKQQQWQQKQLQQPQSPKSAGKWRKKFLVLFVCIGIMVSIWLFWHLNEEISLRRKETLANMCDERARMLQDQFNVSMNHVNALAILVSTFHHGKHPSAIDQKTFGEYTERTAFERPLTSGVAYALRVPHSEREQFEKQQGWTIKKMEIEDQTLVQDCIPDNMDSAPIQDEYAPVIFSQETVSHIVSIDMMSGKEDRENILRARATGKGVLTSPFKLLKSNHLGVVLTFAVYKTDLPPNATPEQRTEATVGYLGASYDVPSLVEKLLHQLASKQTIVVNVYDTTNASAPISMYGTEVVDTGLLHVSSLDFGDPQRKHEMHCRFKQKAPLPWTAINASVGVLVIVLLLGHIFHAAISRITKVENDYREMMELKVRAEAADVAKSQFLATVSHEIRTPMNGVLGMLQMLMDTELDATQRDYAQTAHASGKDLISLINEVLDQAKIESGRLELEDVPFDLRAVLDNVLSLFSGKSNEKGIELAVYVSDQVPEVVMGDPGRFRQIITNLVGNSIKFTQDKGHIFVSVHLADEGCDPSDSVLKQGLYLVKDHSDGAYNTLSGFPVVDRSKSWNNFKMLNGTDMTSESGTIKLLVTVEDTGVGIPVGAQNRIFTPFMQADSSTSRTYGGTGIGLSICKHLVELMHGEIGFVSERGIGSTFSFTCVFRKGETCSLDTKPQLYDPVVSEFRGLRALVIDRSSIRAEVTRYHLQRLGVSVDIASSLKSLCSCQGSACKSSSISHVAMVFIDKDVWDKETGLFLRHVLKELRQNGSADIQEKLPKTFLLAKSMTSTERNELKSTGLVDDVLLKPLRLSVLITCLQETLRKGTKRHVNRKKPSTLGNLLKGKQILVVDDNRVNRRVAEGALKKYGAVVTCVESGKAAIEMLKPPHNFDACFMDLQMPEMDGFQATRQIRHMEKVVNGIVTSGESSVETSASATLWHTPILAMTADVIQATNEECMKCGMDGYVAKPFEEEQLYSAVAQFFDSAR